MNDNRSDDIQDPLQSFERITQPDSRTDYFAGTLNDFHAALVNIVQTREYQGKYDTTLRQRRTYLSTAVSPTGFHQVAEFWGFSAFEMALRERRSRSHNAKDDWSTSSERPMLKRLFKQASSEGWFNSIRDELRWERAYHAAWIRKRIEAIETLDADPELEGVELLEPTSDDIRREVDDSDPIEPIIDAAKAMRDDLAHGSTNLHPNSATTLRQTARLINALFE